MPNIKRNSRVFKTLRSLLEDEKKSMRSRQVLLYAIPHGVDLQERKAIRANEAGGLAYELAYEGLLHHLRDPEQQLYLDEKSSIYFFRKGKNGPLLEFPFELRGHLKIKLHKTAEDK